MENQQKIHWQSLGSKYALDTKWLKIKKEIVKLPSGKILDDFYVVEGGELVAILAIDEKEKVKLVKQYRHAVKDVTIDLPGGGVEKGEQPIDAARRELAEETGMLATNLTKLVIYYPDSGRTACVKHIFLATGLKKDIDNLYSQDKNEDIQLIEMSINDIQKGIKNGELKEATLHIGICAYLNQMKDEKYP